MFVVTYGWGEERQQTEPTTKAKAKENRDRIQAADPTLRPKVEKAQKFEV